MLLDTLNPTCPLTKTPSIVVESDVTSIVSLINVEDEDLSEISFFDGGSKPH